MKKAISILISSLILVTVLTGCDIELSESQQDAIKTAEVADILQGNQPTPTDIQYSLERFNLIRRAYWVNGQREKAMSMTLPIERPLGYVVLLSESGAVIGRFIVDGKVSSLRNYLTPISSYYEGNGYRVNWLTDTDGTYGDNMDGIFFFTTSGNYIEFKGSYIYSDIPFEIADPVLKFEVNE